MNPESIDLEIDAAAQPTTPTADHASEMLRIWRLLDRPYASRILPHLALYVGSIESVTHVGFESLEYDAVVSLVNPKNVSRDEIAAYLREDCAHLYIPLRDRRSADIAQHFQAVYQHIAEHLHGERRVLVHCMAGRSRSVTMCAYYLMRAGFDLSAYDALRRIFEARPGVRPNDGFLEQLLKSEVAL